MVTAIYILGNKTTLLQSEIEKRWYIAIGVSSLVKVEYLLRKQTIWRTMFSLCRLISQRAFYPSVAKDASFKYHHTLLVFYNIIFN